MGLGGLTFLTWGANPRGRPRSCGLLCAGRAGHYTIGFDKGDGLFWTFGEEGGRRWDLASPLAEPRITGPADLLTDLFPTLQSRSVVALYYAHVLAAPVRSSTPLLLLPYFPPRVADTYPGQSPHDSLFEVDQEACTTAAAVMRMVMVMLATGS